MSYLEYIRKAIIYITGEQEIKNEPKSDSIIIAYNEEGERVVIEWIDHIV
jgi:hypothetical protein